MVDRVAKLIDQGKFTVSGARGGVVSRDLSYVEISNMLDAIVQDIHKAYPEMFIQDQFLAFFPTYLKMYLYGHVVNFLYRHQSLTMYTGGPVIPSSVGMFVPRSLLLWLGHLAPYMEGGAQGIITHTITAMPATGTTPGLTAGSPVVTNIGLSQKAVPVYKQEQSLYYELLRSSATITSVDFPTFWSTYAADISAKLEACPYPVIAMPEECGRAPDASAWAHPYNLVATAASPSTSTQLTCVFASWNSEVAMLFLDWSTSYTLQPSSIVRTLPRPCGFYAINNSGIVENTNACEVFQQNFAFISRSTSLAPFEPISSITWDGERINTLNIAMFPVQRYVRDILWSRINSALFNQSTGSAFTTDDVWWFASMVVAKHVEFRRVQYSNPRWEIQAVSGTVQDAGVWPAFSWYWDARLPLLLAQLANEIGPVVHHGQLRCPFIQSMGQPWYMIFNAGTTSPTNKYEWNANPIAGVSASNTFTVVNSIALNVAWRNGYDALTTTYVRTPGICWEHLVGYVDDGIVQGAGYDRGEITWPISDSPRGGLAMLCQSNFGAGVADQDVKIGTRSLTYPIPPYIAGWRAASIIEPFDRACYVLGHYSLAPVNTFGAAIQDLRGSKFYTAYAQDFSYNAFVEEAVIGSVTFGGTIPMLLAKAIRDRHYEGDHLGLVSSVDDNSACLVDALRGVMHTIARSSEAVVPALAGAACSVIGPVAGAACSTGASILTQKVIDLTTDKSNRQSMSKKDVLKALEKDAQMIIKAQKPGDVVTVGPEWGKKAIYQGLSAIENNYRDQRLANIKTQKKQIKKQIKKKAAKKAAAPEGSKASKKNKKK